MRTAELAGKVILQLAEDPVLENFSRPGLCRLWTDRVLELTNDFSVDGQNVITEAREVELEPGFFHTFVRIIVGDSAYLWDGVGTLNHKPYFGKELEAPEHLKNSCIDMLNSFRS